MSQIMKAFLGVFLVLLLSVTATGILSAYMMVADAQDLHAAMVDEVENSNFYPPVLQACFRQAEEAGCQLQGILYNDNYTEVVCAQESQIPTDTSQVSAARLELTFPFQIGFFGMRQEHTFCAYAR